MHAHGNRGKCAQPCRLPYELIKDSSNSEQCEHLSASQSIDKGYLLSTKDLCSLDLLPTLVNLGITCFKIEGRLKNPEYVSTVTRIYRKYIDLAQSNEQYIVDDQDRKDLLQVFNRGGFSEGYLNTKPHSDLICKDKPNNMGIFLGTVFNFNSNKGYITLKLQDDISIGDTVSLEKEKGSYTISELLKNNNNTPYAHKGDIVKIGRIKGNISINDAIYKMSSHDLNNLANEYITGEKIKSKINCKIVVKKEQPISMHIYTSSTADGIYKDIDFTLVSDLIPVDSINTPISESRIVEQINKLGGTPFEFENIEVELDDNLYIPSISKLNQLRRDCISTLENTLLERIHRKCDANIDTFEQTTIYNEHCSGTGKKGVSILLNALNKNYDYSKLHDINRIYIPLKYWYMPEFTDTIKHITEVAKTYIYMPSIMKDSIVKKVMDGLDEILKNYSIAGFVVSNISHMHLLHNYIGKYDFIANYNMNVYNNFTIKNLADSHISCVTLSPELDKATLNSFSRNIETEVIVYGYIPVMTTNYCLLSKSNFCLEKCAGNCSSNGSFYLKDRMNMNFRVIPDSFSKTTTIYNSKKNSISMGDVHSDYVRFNFMGDEDITEMCNIITTFLNGDIIEGKDCTNGNFNRIV